MTRRRFRRLQAAAALALLAAPILAHGGMGSLGTPGGFSAPRGPSRLQLPRHGPMPDSVLAWVGDRRVVSVPGFRRAWEQVRPPAKPDSFTPEAAGRFLDLLIGKDVLAERALRESWQWTRLESAQFVGLRDRLTLQAVLDSVLDGIRRGYAAAGDTAPGAERLGIEARDSTVARLGVRFDEPLLERVTRAFTSLPRPNSSQSMMEQIQMMGARPAVDPADSGRVIAESQAGPARVSDLLDAWNRLNPIYRPRIESASQVRDLVRNGIYERLLRREAERRHLEQRPDIAAALAERREFIAVSHLVEREVYAKIPMDSLTLLACYRLHPDDWVVPERARLIELVLPDRAGGTQMALRLRDAADAESLAARAERQGLGYRTEVSAESDSALFASALRSGTGTVFGPDSITGGWRVARVEAVLPPYARGFDEARPLVEKRWASDEGERRMQETLAALRRQTRVVINRWALERLSRPARTPKTAG